MKKNRNERANQADTNQWHYYNFQQPHILIDIMPGNQRPELRHAGPTSVNPVKVRGPTGLYAREAEPRKRLLATCPP